jgi:hypothetical protein
MALEAARLKLLAGVLDGSAVKKCLSELAMKESVRHSDIEPARHLRDYFCSCSYGLDLFLLSIDEGIAGYRDDSLETVKRNEQTYGIPLQVRLLLGMTVGSRSQADMFRRLKLGSGCHCCPDM